jgi:hypothetical protein
MSCALAVNVITVRQRSLRAAAVPLRPLSADAAPQHVDGFAQIGGTECTRCVRAEMATDRLF